MLGYIYCLHFTRPLGNLSNARAQASHYLGWALDPERRNAEHLAGQGAAITRAAVERGIGWELFVLGEGDRHLERLLKQKKATPRFCPLCGRTHPGGRLHLPPTTWQQLELCFDDFAVESPWNVTDDRTPFWARSLGQTRFVIADGGDIPF
jgi:hypothetical protein